jgi:hypothetical protein
MMKLNAKKFNSQVAHKYKILALPQKLDPSAFKTKQRDYDDDGQVDLPDHPPKLLYHVTHKKNLDSIKKKGLIPKIGSVTRSAHGDKENPATPLVYLLDTVASGILKTFGKDAIIITVDPKIEAASLAKL